MNWRRLGSLAGMIGTATFMVVFLLLGWLQPDYDPRRMTISELALGANGWIQSVNFVFLGLLTIFFARGLASEFPTGKASKAGPILLAIIGICAIGSGIFVTEPTSVPPTEWAWQGWVHVGFSLIAFVLFPIVAFVFYRRFRADSAWKSFAGWTLLVAVILSVMFVISFFLSGVPAIQGFTTEWAGILQRLTTVVFNGWLLIFACRLYQKSQFAAASDTRHQERMEEVGNPH